MKVLLVLCFILLCAPGFGQKFTIPKDAKFDVAEDYEAQHESVIAAVDYLEQTPPDQQPGYRKQVNAYLLQWLTGTPTVTLSLDGNIVTFMEQADCFMLYMGAYARYALQEKTKDPVAANVAAINSVLSFYNANKAALGKVKALDKYQKLADKGKLESTLKKLIEG
ncbi:MAG: hypothetical protein AAF597_01020 [Bacteroidota bacterium]